MAAQAHTETQLISWDELKCLLVAIVGLVVLRIFDELALRVPANMDDIPLIKSPIIHKGIHAR
jgi:hypothetical protein